MGRPPVLNKKIIKKIADRAGKPELSIVKSVSALASRKNISPEVALISEATKYGVGTASILKKLDQNQHLQLNIVQKQNTDSIIKPSNGLNRKTIKQGSRLTNDFDDPYLQKSLYSNIPSEAYSIMFTLENSIRAFIARNLLKAYGEKWWDKLVEKNSTNKITKTVATRKTVDSGNWYHSKRGSHEIYYTDFSHLLKIINEFSENFSELLMKSPQKNLIGKLDELSPTRNIIAHNNPITSKDLDRLKVHARDWFSYMRHLKSEVS
jgi:hypothetical protein